MNRRVLAVCSVLAGVVALSLSPERFASAQNAQSLSGSRPTLAEFARAQARSLPGRYAPRAWLAPRAQAAAQGGSAHGCLLFVSAAPLAGGRGFVNIYSAAARGPHPPLLGQITGLDNPSAIAVDAHGALYVVQTAPGAPVLEFPLGARTPVRALQTLGNEPVGVAVSPAGTVFVSTANTGTASAKILVYAPGRTLPAKHFDNLAGDQVGALRTDEHGNVYFAADTIGYGNYVGEVTTASVVRTLLAFNTPVIGIELDRVGNLLAQENAVGVYARDSARLLRTFSVGGIQSLAFDATDSAFYSGIGSIYEYAYPSGKLLDSFTDLNAYNTFGIATYPAAPHGAGW